MDVQKICETCPLNGSEVDDKLMNACWLRFMAAPALATAVLSAPDDASEVQLPEQPTSDDILLRAIVADALQKRSAIVVIAECFTRRRAGDCTESDLYKYITADFILPEVSASE